MEELAHLNVEGIPKELDLILAIIINDDRLYRDLTLKENIDWHLFLELAMHHRVFPLVYSRLFKQNHGLLPSFVMESLERSYKRNTFHMLHLSAEMEKINEMFLDNGIKSLFLKGPILAKELYGDLSLRTSGDIDLLIHIEDIAKADRLLVSFGYKQDEYIHSLLNDWKWRHHHFTYYHEAFGTKVEVHWRLNPAPSNEPAFHELWQRKQRSTTHQASRLFFLGNEDLFFFLVTHGARHGWSRLRWLADIHQIVEKGLNWTKVELLLRKHKGKKIAGQALILSAVLFQTDVPKDAQMFITRKANQLAAQALFYLRNKVNLHSGKVPRDVAKYHALHLFSLMSYQQKIAYIFMMLHPLYSDLETLPLPRKLHFLYYPLRPFLWTWRKTRNITKYKNMEVK
ncbi:nucleotidyltransferase domain-containing protein [Cytobacillus purgationiresistens]|nr:nucleotidyltransferase family protein [Cytobacillus purgationiresistens]